jgi:hypothetical protein
MAPQKDESHGGQPMAIENQARTNDPDSAKHFATLQARLALNGWVTSLEASGAINVSRWGHIRTVDTIAELEAFARRAGVKP